MRILFIGDVVGQGGIDACTSRLPALRQELKLDGIVVNGENAVNGRGLTPEVADQLFRAGADMITGGNHIWHFKEIEEYMEHESRLLRPANYRNAAGHGAYSVRLQSGHTLGVIHVEGLVFMRSLACPFETVEKEIKAMGKVDAILVDVHAEATSEKQAIGWHFDGRVAAVVGTHTHVPTADERILPRGTAFITDVGMTGPYDSVIGMDSQAAIKRLRSQRRGRHLMARDNVKLCGVLIEMDPKTGRSKSIQRIMEDIPA